MKKSTLVGSVILSALASNIAFGAASGGHYDKYKDIRGSAAEPISRQMGIDGPSPIENTGHLVEIRVASDHFRLSAHGKTHAREVLIYTNSVQVIDLDEVEQKATKTIYSADGRIVTLTAGWDKFHGYQGQYKQVAAVDGQMPEVEKQLKHYNATLSQAQKLAR